MTDDICTLCEGNKTLIDNVTGKEYRCPRCLGTGINILKTVTRIILPQKEKPNKENKK
jgi:hypothetical protein